jgi:hypothetical protein
MPDWGLMLVKPERFLDLQFLFFKLREYRAIGRWPTEFFSDTLIKSGMFGFKGKSMRRYHSRVSLSCDIYIKSLIAALVSLRMRKLRPNGIGLGKMGFEHDDRV